MKIFNAMDDFVNEKICFPHKVCGKFDSLKEAKEKLTAIDGYFYPTVLLDIIRYNVCYRDYMRANGKDAILKRISEELDEPTLVNSPIMSTLMRMRLSNGVSYYDIQCYHINDKVEILGHVFDGLEDIRNHVSLYASETDERGCQSYYVPRCSKTENEVYEDISIGELAQWYFDQNYKSQSYQNYIFRATPITQEDMEKAFSMFDLHHCSHNFCGVNETIRCDGLPMLYHDSMTEYMLLATDKNK